MELISLVLCFRVNIGCESVCVLSFAVVLAGHLISGPLVPVDSSLTVIVVVCDGITLLVALAVSKCISTAVALGQVMSGVVEPIRMFNVPLIRSVAIGICVSTGWFSFA